MKKLLFLTIFIALIRFSVQNTFAAYQITNQTIQFPELLQGTTLPLQSSNTATAWQGSVPILVSNSANAILTNETPIQPGKKNQEQTIYTNPDSVVLSSQNGQPINQAQQTPLNPYFTYPSAAYLPIYSIQPVATILLQGNTTPDTNITIQSSTQNQNYIATIPTLDQNASFVLDTLNQTLTNKVISGLLNTLTNIPNSSLVNSAINIVGGNGISLSSNSVHLGDTLTISAPTSTNTTTIIASGSGVTALDNLTGPITLDGNGIASVSNNNGVITVSANEIDTLDDVVARGASTAKQVTLSNLTNAINAGTLTATGGTINGVTIGNITPATGIFQTVNGLTIDNKGNNALAIGSGKTVTFGNSVTFNGTDGTSLTLPPNSDTLVGLTTAQTLTNKTIAAGSNTISGLTASNFISNALSQWTNDIGYITASSTNTLTNKTLTAATNTISGLTVSNFATNALSQWTNDAGFITTNGTQTLTNKTIDATTNTVSNITNANLSGNAGISNANLANPSITVSLGNGLSGGVTVPLGGTLALTNTGVTSLLGTNNQVNISSNSGAITLSLPQDIGTSSMPTFGGLTVNGILNGTGALSGFSTINGLTISPNSSGFTLSGGTTAKSLTIGNSLTLNGTDGTTFTLPSASDTIVGLSSSQTLANKTISASSNTISNLTNANLSGNAGISNTNLANPSITISSGNGLSGGSTVALGGSVTLANTGVTSLTGTSNQVNISGSTGSILLSLPQNIGLTSTPTFGSLTLSSTSNQITFGTNGILSWSPSTTATLTLPNTTDTLIGRTTTDVLTNKTLSAPAINGTVTTTGLTLPTFTANGTINGSGSPTITNFGSINGLTFNANASGFSISGGTTAKTLTLNNSLTFAGTDATTMTFPSSSDTLVGLSAIQTLTNKTLTAPTINGIVTSTGLTLPSFIANGTIDQSGSSGSILTGSGGMTINGNASVSAGKTFAVTDPDKLTVGGTIIPQEIPITVSLLSTLLTQPIFVADATYQVSNVKCFYSVGALLNGTLQITADSGNSAPGSGIAQLSSAINLSSTTNTTYTGSLISNPTILNAGDRLTAKLGGTLASLLGTCTIYVKRV